MRVFVCYFWCEENEIEVFNVMAMNMNRTGEYYVSSFNVYLSERRKKPKSHKNTHTRTHSFTHLLTFKTSYKTA